MRAEIFTRDNGENRGKDFIGEVVKKSQNLSPTILGYKNGFFKPAIGKFEIFAGWNVY